MTIDQTTGAAMLLAPFVAVFSIMWVTERSLIVPLCLFGVWAMLVAWLYWSALLTGSI